MNQNYERFADLAKSISQDTLKYLGKVEQLPNETSKLLVDAWIKHLPQINADDLESCSLALLNELLKAKLIPKKVGDHLRAAFQHYLLNSGD